MTEQNKYPKNQVLIGYDSIRNGKNVEHVESLFGLLAEFDRRLAEIEKKLGLPTP